MLTTVLILTALVWIPIILLQISRRAFVVLLIWLALAPIIMSFMSGRAIRLLTPAGSGQPSAARDTGGIDLDLAPQDITGREVIREPARLLFAAFVLVFLVNALLTRSSMISFQRTELWMGLFSLLLIGNIVLWSDRVPYSLRTAIDTFIIPFLAYSLSRRLISNEDQFRQITKIFGYLGVCLIMVGLFDRLSQVSLTYRITGLFKNGTIFYHVLAATFIAVLSDMLCSKYLPKDKQALSKGVRLFVLYLAPLLIFLTWSRGNWTGLLFGVWVFLFLGWRMIDSNRRTGTIGVVLTISALVAIGLQFYIPDAIIERRVGNENTIIWRFERWSLAFQSGIQNPVFGVGLNNLRDVFGKNLGNYYSAHNQFLSMFAELGIAGLSIYLAVTCSIIRTGLILYRNGTTPLERWRGLAVVSVVMSLVAPALFADTMQATGLWLVYPYVFLGAVAGLYTRRRAGVQIGWPGVPRYLSDRHIHVRSS